MPFPITQTSGVLKLIGLLIIVQVGEREDVPRPFSGLRDRLPFCLNAFSCLNSYLSVLLQSYEMRFPWDWCGEGHYLQG